MDRKHPSAQDATTQETGVRLTPPLESRFFGPNSEGTIHRVLSLVSQTIRLVAFGALVYLLATLSPPHISSPFAFVMTGTFGVLPFALQRTFLGRKVLTFPLFVVFITMGLMIVLSESIPGTETAPSIASLSIFMLTGALGGAYLFRREIIRSLVRPGLDRSEARIKVDALVRIRFCPDGSDPRTYDPDSQNAHMLPVSHCVVVRDISPSGVGIYGFPEDVTAISTAFSGHDVAILEVIYREESYFLPVDCRWWKGGPQKGECGLKFSPSPAASKLYDTLLVDAGKQGSFALEALLTDRAALPMFSSLTWLFSLIGILILLI